MVPFPMRESFELSCGESGCPESTTSPLNVSLEMFSGGVEVGFAKGRGKIRIETQLGIFNA